MKICPSYIEILFHSICLNIKCILVLFQPATQFDFMIESDIKTDTFSSNIDLRNFHEQFPWQSQYLVSLSIHVIYFQCHASWNTTSHSSYFNKHNFSYSNISWVKTDCHILKYESQIFNWLFSLPFWYFFQDTQTILTHGYIFLHRCIIQKWFSKSE